MFQLLKEKHKIIVFEKCDSFFEENENYIKDFGLLVKKILNQI